MYHLLLICVFASINDECVIICFSDRPTEVIVFMVGGLTYQEAALVHAFNRDAPKNNISARVIIGGTTIHNTRRYVSKSHLRTCE